MSSADVKTFVAKAGSVEITLSAFVDQNGYWAKDFTECEKIRVGFADSTVCELTPAEYLALTPAQKVLIQEAPSSPLPGAS